MPGPVSGSSPRVLQLGAGVSPRTTGPAASAPSAPGTSGVSTFDPASPSRWVPTPGVPAEQYARPLEAGTFPLPPRGGLSVRGVYFDFAVQNFSFEKQLSVTARVARQDGSVEEMLVRPFYKGRLADGSERWGCDLPVFHDSGPHGPVTAVSFDYAVQVDLDGDGKRELLRSENVYKAASGAELAGGAHRAQPSAAGRNSRVRPEVDVSGLDAAAKRLAQGDARLEVYFTPDRGARDAICREISAVIAAKRADPSGTHYIHASVYNINSEAIVSKLIEAKQAGVEVRLFTSAPQMMPDRPWEAQYQRLQRAGVEVVGVQRDGINSNHLKVAVFDGKVAATGSFNWEDGAEQENFENLLLLRSPEAALLYESIIQASGGAQARAARVDGPAKVRVHYSQAEDALAAIIDEIDRAKDSIVLSQFQVREAWDERGRSLTDALGRAAERGVKVTLITDARIADGGDYHGISQPDDPTDEALERRGVHVVTVLSPYGQYASMHDKFAVFDGRTTLTGAYNWWGPSESSDDDFIAIDDPTLAKVFLGEARNLQAHFDPAFDRGAAPKTRLDFRARVPTQPGQEVTLVGDLPELGGWDPSKGLKLDGGGYPTWSGAAELPSGVAFRYKYVVRGPDGDRWESGPDRRWEADPLGGRETVNDSVA